MFSRREREFLRLLAEAPLEGGSGRLERSFPNPVYRRRLFWGIRHKAVTGAQDWELYTRAAARDPRLVRPGTLDPSESVPVHTEPFASLARGLGRFLRPPKARRTGRPATEGR